MIPDSTKSDASHVFFSGKTDEMKVEKSGRKRVVHREIKREKKAP